MVPEHCTPVMLLLPSYVVSTAQEEKAKQSKHFLRIYGIINAKERGENQEKPCTERQESADVQETRRPNRRIILADVLWRRAA
jgi:hypothetical protein